MYSSFIVHLEALMISLAIGLNVLLNLFKLFKFNIYSNLNLIFFSNLTFIHIYSNLTINLLSSLIVHLEALMI